MRIADKMINNQVISGIEKNRNNISELQNQAATQKRVTKPSSDPLAASKVLESRKEYQENVQFVKNINIAKSFLEYTDHALSELTDSLVRAKELAIGQAGDTGATEMTRKTVAQEVEQLFWQAVQVANRKLGDRYIFGGYKTTNNPFDSLGNYKGDDGNIFIQINKDAYVAMNIPGDEVFHGKRINQQGDANNQGRIIKNFEDLNQYDKNKKNNNSKEQIENNVKVDGKKNVSDDYNISSGINVFNALKSLEISLNTNDKEGIQDSLTKLDEALSQVILSRAQLGSRVMAIESMSQGLEDAKINNKTVSSNLEDVDMFELIHNMNLAEKNLKTSLASSGKLIQPSLLDFLS